MVAFGTFIHIKVHKKYTLTLKTTIPKRDGRKLRKNRVRSSATSAKASKS